MSCRRAITAIRDTDKMTILTTHIALQLGRFPHEQLDEETVLATEELRMGILKDWGKILAREVIEDVDQEHHRLRDLGQIWRRWRGKEKRSRVQEEWEEWPGEVGEHIVDDGKEGI